MAEKLDPKETARFNEITMANSIMVEALAQLLMEKGFITNDEFFTKLKEVQMEYQSKKNA